MKFSIRDLLLLTLVVALAVGWWLERCRLIGERDRWRAEWAEERMKSAHTETHGVYPVAKP
jgi:hypothetical protein